VPNDDFLALLAMARRAEAAEAHIRNALWFLDEVREGLSRSDEMQAGSRLDQVEAELEEIVGERAAREGAGKDGRDENNR
jgi:tetrahydromethanopterin S-methyltransferase subunit G